MSDHTDVHITSSTLWRARRGTSDDVMEGPLLNGDGLQVGYLTVRLGEFDMLTEHLASDQAELEQLRTAKDAPPAS